MDIITGKILKLNNWRDGKIIGLAKDAGNKLMESGLDREAALHQLDAVRQNPTSFLSDSLLADLARECIRLSKNDEPSSTNLHKEPLPFPIWGKDQIDLEAIKQMQNAMRLPVTVTGALMPDAHVGYGLPIGGVLATENVVIPYAVGVDIACRMRLSLYEVSPILLGQKKGMFEESLWNETAFGMGAKWTGSKRASHEVLDDDAWYATKQLKMLKDTAMNQLGTSGTGNHFVEWGSFRLHEDMFGLKAGEYLALLSHSGSRGVGAKIADRFSKLAMEKHPDLDKSVRHLAWLDLDSEDGAEYWVSMELAGKFASANHYIIHKRVSASVGLKEVAVVENHHNFCLPGNTIIPTTGGPKKMSDICENDKIYSFDNRYGIIETKVIQHWYSGKKQTVTLKTSNRKLTASLNHPILTIEVDKSRSAHVGHRKQKGELCWKTMGEILVGDIVVCAENYYETDQSIGEDRARLIGAFLGDGWVRHNTTHGRYTVGLAIGSMKEKHTQKYLSILQKELPPANWVIDSPGAFGLTCMSSKVWYALEEMGLIAYSNEKQIPRFIFNLPRNEKLAFLAGYIDADGSVANSKTDNHGRATIATTNESLAHEIREIAIACQLRVTTVRKEYIKSNFGDTHVFRYNLSADSTCKLDLWHDLKSKNQRNTIYKILQGLVQRKIGYISLPPNTFAQRVIAVEEGEVEEVYDLTVDNPSHSFIAEGIVTHNCWREKLLDGRDVYVHRKGATPAGKGVLGVIPGSMGDAGYVVRGRGVSESLESASHGAGRLMSRRAAINSISKKTRDDYLKERGVTLLGGGIDESPQAYKPIDEVISAQQDLVDVIGKFTPKIVRMADEPGDI